MRAPGPSRPASGRQAEAGHVIDVSLGIGPGLPIWPGDPPAVLDPASRIAEGGSSNVSELRLGTHTGTHIDPPYHFLEDGARVDELPLDVLIGAALVVDMTDTTGPIGPEELDRLTIPQGTTRLLLRTRNSAMWRNLPQPFPDRYVALSPEGARWIVDKRIRLVGIDFLSIEVRDAPGHPVHRTLLKAGVVIVEGLDLSAVTPGRYTLACLPLKLIGGDGAPARAVLIDLET